MPYKKSNKQIQAKKLGPLKKNVKNLALNKNLDNDSESGGYTGQPKQHGSPFEMKAKYFGNSPMQKNFSGSLAINKKLDKDSMSGGLTGQPSGETGKLGHGPILKKKGGIKSTPKFDKFKADFGKFTKGFGTGMKQFGSQIKSGIGKTSSNIKTGKPLLSGTFMGKDGGKIKKAADVRFKTKTATTGNLNNKFIGSSLAPGLAGAKNRAAISNLKIKKPVKKSLGGGIVKANPLAKTSKPSKSTKTGPDWSKAPKLNTQKRADWYKKHNLKGDTTTKVKKTDHRVNLNVNPSKPPKTSVKNNTKKNTTKGFNFGKTWNFSK